MKNKYSDYLEFNINQEVLVKLTGLGYDHWYTWWHRYDYLKPDLKIKKDGYSLKELHAKADKNGFVTFQLWEFMNIFGDVTYNGSKLYYYLDIMMKKSDLEEYEEK